MNILNDHELKLDWFDYESLQTMEKVRIKITCNYYN